MVHNQDTIEERLIVLESAMAALASTSAIKHDELATQVADSLQQMSERFISQQNTLQAIADQQKVLETKLDLILKKQHGLDNARTQLLEANVEQQKDVSSPASERQEYVNWKQKHDNLLQRSYVPYYDLFDTLQILNQYESAPRKLINMLQRPFKVNKTTRFPSNTWYVNVNNPRIKHEIDDVLFAIEDERGVPNYQSDIDKVLNVLRSLSHGYGIYDLTSFEKICNLKWAYETEREHTEDNVEKHDNDVILKEGELQKSAVKQVKQDESVNQIKNQTIHSSSAETLPKENHGYINWDQTHSVLETHSYVGFRALHDTIQFWKTSSPPGFPKQLNIACAQQKISNIFGPLFNIDKTKRFPSHGLYLNVNLPAIQLRLESLFSYINGYNFNVKQFDFEINKFFNAIDVIFMNSQDGLYNRIGFEEKYELKWVEKENSDDQISPAIL